jgi:glutathione S-transferase
MRTIIVTKPQDVPKGAIDGKPTVVYWDIVGLANSLRLAMVASGADFCDVRIAPGQVESDNYKCNWTAVKTGLGKVLAFPNLPYFMDDKVKLSQSNTILRYIGRTFDLMGVPGQEHVVDMALDELSDLESAFATLCYRDGPEGVAPWYQQEVVGKLAQWKTLVGDKDYLTGDRMSVADLKLYVFLYKLTVLQKTLGDESTASKLSAWEPYMKRIEETPKIKEYMASPDYQRHPLNNPHALFGNN